MDKLNRFDSWIGHSYDKIFLDEGKPEGAKSEYKIYSAKGETEGCAIGVWSENGTEIKMNIRGEEPEGVTGKLYNICESMTVDGKIYTDATVPASSGDTFKVEAGKAAAFLIEFTVCSSANAGEYNYEVEITDGDGNTLASHGIVLHIWNFEISRAKKLEATIYYTEEPLKAYYKMLADHNICGRLLPVDIRSAEADAYLSDPAVTSFMVRHQWGEEILDQVYKKLETNPEWMKKAFFYPIDEPNTKEKLDEFAKICTQLEEKYPKIRRMVPIYTNIQYDEEADQTEFMSRYINNLCPKLCLWDECMVYTPEQAEKYPSFGDRMKALQERGDKVWAYVCNYPPSPYLNVRLTDKGIEARVLFWQIYQRGIDGFLYWRATFWDKLPGRNPWNSLDSFGDGILGDGILIYPDREKGAEVPVASIRLKIMRNGVDDNELLCMAEKHLGKAWVTEKVNEVSRSLTTIDVTSDGFADVRVEIGNALEDALKNS